MIDKVVIGPVTLYRGSAIEVLATLPDNSVDGGVTDPPYGLGGAPDIAEVLTHWLRGDDYAHSGGGFMGKGWDSFVPGPATWREVFRVLKPGAHLCVCSGTRTHGVMEVALRLAGFEIRDAVRVVAWSRLRAGAERARGKAIRFASLAWTYGCLDAESECLTRRGWVTHEALREDDDVLQWDAATGGLSWVRPQAVHRYDYDGPMVCLGVEMQRIGSCAWTPWQLLTPNHRVFRRDGRWEDWSASEAQSINFHRGLSNGGFCVPDVVGQWAAHEPDGEFAARIISQRTPPDGSYVVRLADVPYSGKVWCVTVPTGAFVARRLGRPFITGNSGFPKSLDASKAIDAAAGATREVVGFDAARARPNRQYEGGAIGNIGGTGKVSDRTDNGATLTAPATPLAKRYRGYGTALKPAYEPVILARKPLEGTLAANLAKWGTGALNIDGCRVRLAGGESGEDLNGGTYSGGKRNPVPGDTRSSKAAGRYGEDGRLNPEDFVAPAGRWPPNVVLSHHPGCQRAGTKAVPASSGIRPKDVGIDYEKQHKSGSMAGAKGVKLCSTYSAEDGTEQVAAWECVAGCPVAALDAQSGTLSSGSGKKNTRKSQVVCYGAPGAANEQESQGDTGGASRFFPTFQPTARDFTPFLYCAKAPRSEREAGCEALPARTGAEAVDRAPDTDGLKSPRAGAGRTAAKVRNHHPCVKPLGTMRWLVRLIAPPGNPLIIDPFFGSGTTAVATMEEGCSFVGCDLDDDNGQPAGYLAIAEARVRHALSGRDVEARLGEASVEAATAIQEVPAKTLPSRASENPVVDFLARLSDDA